MHRAFANWLIARPWRLSVFAALFGVLSLAGMSIFAIPAGAIPVLATLARNVRSGLQTALAGSVAVAALFLAIDQSLQSALIWTALVFLAPFALTVLAQRVGSMSVVVQVSVLVAALMIVAIFVGTEDPIGSWQKLTNELIHSLSSQLSQSGSKLDETAMQALLAQTNWGTLVAGSMLSILCSLFLGSWWQSLAQAPGAFGKEFQQLSLGKVLSSLAAVAIVTAYAAGRLDAPVPILDAMFWICAAALAMQGLAVVHRLRANGRIGRLWLIVVYVLVVFFEPETVLLLAGCGWVDNWRRIA